MCSLQKCLHTASHPKMFQRLYFDRQQLLPEEIYFEIYSFSKNKMTFPMSENKTIKIVMDDDSCEENHKSAKELEDDKRAEKEAQQKLVSITNNLKKQINKQTTNK